MPRTQSPRRVAGYRTSSISNSLENSKLSQDYGEHLAPLCTSYHMATRALANLSLEGDKLANRPRGHVITGLLQFENLLCRIITERTRLTFLWKSANTFLFGKAVEMRKRTASKATSP